MAFLRKHIPGILFAALVAVIAYLLQLAEVAIFGQPIIEGLVIAILLGMLWRTARGMPANLAPGVAFSSKQVLEFAIVLLGVSIDLPALLKEGWQLLVVIVALVMLGIFASSQIGRAMKLPPRLATLVAVGNSICGNSAIAAVAPVIKASKEEVASSVSLTAVIGVVLVLSLPFLIPILSFTQKQFGVLVGLTVYAVPQVVAAAAPVGELALAAATSVKLVRVLMLGPVVAFYALRNPDPDARAKAFSLSRFVPWFVAGFIIMALLRSLAIVPVALADPLREISRYLTILAMAALGLGADLRVVSKVGRPVALTVIGSLLVLIVISIVLIKVVGIGVA